MTKVGLLFFLNRLTGEPIFGVEERPVPPTDALGDARGRRSPSRSSRNRSPGCR
jgi:quinoprotein glucose dehydrogenase